MSSGALAAILPIKRSSVAGHVAKRLLDLLRTGKLKPGDQLPSERDLARMLLVGRPSLPRGSRPADTRSGKIRQGDAHIFLLRVADLLGPVPYHPNVQKVHALCESCAPIDGTGARIVTALASRNAAAAEEAIVAHIHDVQQSTLGAIEELRGGRI
jgi:hypothetical protein